MKKGKVGKVKITHFVAGAVFGDLGSSILEGKKRTSRAFWRGSQSPKCHVFQYKTHPQSTKSMQTGALQTDRLMQVSMNYQP